MPGFDHEENRERLLRRMLPVGGLGGLSENVSPRRERGQLTKIHRSPRFDEDPAFAGGSTSAHLLVLSATSASIASGGDYVDFDAVVAQYEFDSHIDLANDSWTHPESGVYLLDYEHAWDSFTDGGTIRLELDGTLIAAGVIADATSGQNGRGTIAYYADADSVGKIKVTQSSGSAQTCDATVRIAMSDPRAIGWQIVFAADAWGLTNDGTNWWTTEGSSGATVSERSSDGSVVSSFEASAVGSRVRGITWDGTHLWVTGDADGVVAEYTTAGVLNSSFTIPNGDWNEQVNVGIAHDGTDLWHAGQDTDELRRYTTAGVHQQTISLTFDPWGVAYYDGRLYVVDRSANLVHVIDPTSGSTLGTIDVSGAVSSPSGVWISDDGVLYVSKDADNVYKRTVSL